MIVRAFPNLISENLSEVKAWYVDVLGWETEYDSDWFVHLKARDVPGTELGIFAADHELVSHIAESEKSGFMLTVVVDDVDETHHKAVELGCEIIEEPKDLFYGQRRMILRDPDGTFVDVSSECEPSQEFLASLPHRSSH